MLRTVVTIIMAGASLVALGLLVRAVWRAREAGDVDASTALTLGAGWLATLPITIVVITGGLQQRPDAFGQLTAVLPGWYLEANRLGLIGIAALAAYLMLRRLSARRVAIHAAALFALSLWAVAHLAGGLHSERLLSLAGGVLLVCLMAAMVLPRGRGAAVGVAIFGATLAIASAALAVFRQDAAFVSDCQGACSGLGLTGVLPNPNLLGVSLVAALPFAFLGFRGRARYFFALYLAGMAIATGSRTAAGAAIVAIVALLVVRPRLDADRANFGRSAIAALVLAGALVASVYVVRHDWDSTALTDRPHLWEIASSYINQSPWFGYGPYEWAQLAQSSDIPQAAQRSAHNQWMDVLFVAGWVGAALFVGMLLAAVWSAGRARPGVLLALATTVMLGTTEGAWSVGAFDLASFSLLALILTGEANTARAPEAIGAETQVAVCAGTVSRTPGPGNGPEPSHPTLAELTPGRPAGERFRTPPAVAASAALARGTPATAAAPLAWAVVGAPSARRRRADTHAARRHGALPAAFAIAALGGAAAAGWYLPVLLGGGAARTNSQASAPAPPRSGPSEAYTAALSRTLERLNERRTELERAFRRARTARAQGRAASSLGAAHARAAAALSIETPTPPQRRANATIVAALREMAAGYRGMAAAARGGDSRGFTLEAGRVRRSDARVRGAVERL